MVTPGNPLKDNGSVPPLAERMRTAARVAAHPRIFVSGAEAGFRTRYTADLIAILKARAPGDALRLDHGERRSGRFSPLGELAGDRRLRADRGREPAENACLRRFSPAPRRRSPATASTSEDAPMLGRPRAAGLDFPHRPARRASPPRRSGKARLETVTIAPLSYWCAALPRFAWRKGTTHCPT